MTQSFNTKIYEFIYNHPTLNQRIIKLVPKDLRQDMKSHLIIELNKMNNNKLNKLYNDQELIKYTMRMLYYQMSPDCRNCFRQMYFPSIFKVNNQELIKETIEQEIEFEFKDEAPQIKHQLAKEVLSILLEMEMSVTRKLTLYQIFLMSYIQGYSAKEIAEMTNTPLQTIKNFKTKGLKDVKKILIQNGYNTN